MSESKTNTNTPKRGKVNGYKHSFLDAKKDRRRQEAEKRQEAYDGLTLKARVKLAKGRRGESKKELAKLDVLLENEKKLKEPTKTDIKVAAKDEKVKQEYRKSKKQLTHLANLVGSGKKPVKKV
jgi:hypothetical protein